MTTLVSLVIFSALLIQSGVESVTQNETVYTGCGGEVQLELGNVIYISYKLDQPYIRYERCIWHFKSDQENPYSIKANVVSHGFGSGTGVALYTVDPERSNLSSYFLDAEILLHPLSFLLFATDSYYGGKGFKVQIQLQVRENQHLSPLPKYTVASLTTWHDFYRHPLLDGTNYDANERVYVIVNPPNHAWEYWRLNVDFMDIEKCGADDTCTCDYLEVYRIVDVNGYSRHARLCGEVPRGTTHIVTQKSSEPMLLLFHTQKNSTTAAGFQVTWEQHQ